MNEHICHKETGPWFNAIAPVQPKLHRVLAILSAVGVKSYSKDRRNGGLNLRLLDWKSSTYPQHFHCSSSLCIVVAWSMICKTATLLTLELLLSFYFAA